MVHKNVACTKIVHDILNVPLTVYLIVHDLEIDLTI